MDARVLRLRLRVSFIRKRRRAAPRFATYFPRRHQAGVGGFAGAPCWYDAEAARAEAADEVTEVPHEVKIEFSNTPKTFLRSRVHGFAEFNGLKSRS